MVEIVAVSDELIDDRQPIRHGLHRRLLRIDDLMFGMSVDICCTCAASCNRFVAQPRALLMSAVVEASASV